jgi:hypothetical protein
VEKKRDLNQQQTVSQSDTQTVTVIIIFKKQGEKNKKQRNERGKSNV